MKQLSFESTIRKNLPVGIIQPRRGQIYVGFRCHQKCGFCYYANRCHEEMFDLADIWRQIDFEYRYGIREFEITGGEPSEHRQLREICLYIKKKDNRNKIAIITNGGLWKSDVWDIIDEVLLSYHTPRDEHMADKTMFPLGTTYEMAERTVKTANAKNVFLRTNTVVATFNVDALPLITEDLIGFRPRIINFLPVNLFDDAGKMHKFIDYDMLRRALKHSIDAIKEKLPACEINIRYMPFCGMQGYEKHIVGQLQHIYDEHDWNRELGGVNVIEMSKNQDMYLTQLGLYGSKSIEAALRNRDIFYTKTNECLRCKYYIICDGVEKTANNELTKYIRPSAGKIIKNILEFKYK